MNPICPCCKKEMFSGDADGATEKWYCSCGVITIVSRYKGGKRV